MTRTAGAADAKVADNLNEVAARRRERGMAAYRQRQRKWVEEQHALHHGGHFIVCNACEAARNLLWFGPQS